MNELRALPCPFCGKQPDRREVNFWTGMRNDLIRVEYMHHCVGLDPRHSMYIKASAPTDVDALAAWNRRL